MFPYLLAFALSAGIAFFIKPNEKKNGDIGQMFLLGLCAILPAVLAGMRDLNVGTDTGSYVSMLFQYGVAIPSLIDFCNLYSSQYDLGYLVLTFASGKIVPDVHFFLFVVELIMTSSVLTALYKLTKGKGLWVGYLLYLLLFFNESLNMVRQSLAMAMLLLAIVYLFENKTSKYLICVVVASLFHSTGLIGLMYFVIYKLVKYGSQHTMSNGLNLSLRQFATTAVLLVAPIVFSLLFVEIVSFSITNGLISSRFAIYLTDTSTGVTGLVFFAYAIDCVMLFVMRKRVNHGTFFSLCFVYGVILFLLTGYSKYLWRIATFFIYPIVLAIASPYSSSIAESKTTSLLSMEKLPIAVILLVSLFLWYVQIVVWGNHETIPYMSAILGI